MLYIIIFLSYQKIVIFEKILKISISFETTVFFQIIVYLQFQAFELILMLFIV